MHVFFCVSKNVSVSCAYTQGKREQFSGFNRTLDAINNVFRKFSAFHDETGRFNVDGMNIISNDGSNKLNRSRKARVSYKVQRTINASLNAATSTRAVDRKSGSAGMPRPISYAVFRLKKKDRPLSDAGGLDHARQGLPQPAPATTGQTCAHGARRHADRVLGHPLRRRAERRPRQHLPLV